ncbi:MAG: DUF2027 domain-containing protein [Tannerella sp.]|jgi:hypothetical protein|nr:DUF2027 domain-containing protein [Tannerella sp.]
MRKEDFRDASSSPKAKLGIGDKVRFLNSVGGGTVTAFRGKDQVLVEDENGFDVPVLIAECVVVGEADRRMENREPEPYVPPVKKVAAANVTPPETDGGTSGRTGYAFAETPQGERLNLSLAFLPAEPKNFMQSAFVSYLVNESNYYVYVSYMSCKNNSWTGRYHGLIEPDTKIFIEEIEKPALNELEHTCVQIIAFKEGKSFSLKSAMSIELHLDMVKFYKLHCFIPNDFFDEDALVIPLVVNDVPEKQMLVSAVDIREAMYERKKEERRAPQPAAKKVKPANEAVEVDLHINQLTDNASGMSSADMLNCQMSKFHEVMKANAGKKGRKTIFIHGKGEGVLRAAIEKELKTTYRQQVRFQDASFREYGFGATMVIVY